jgi:glycolate oxidase FAD binding subunit
MPDFIQHLSDTIRAAADARRPLAIRGSGSKAFHGHAVSGDALDVTGHRGIISYEPTELVITARAGTPLSEIEAVMRSQGQMLGFEPPQFGAGGTMGGCIAAGLSGPRRVAAGSVRDFVLGLRLLDGRGRDLSFGGQVMKNVAGFDVSRLICGSLGTLGVVLEVSLKVLPLPPAELTLVQEHGQAAALRLMNAWGGQALPISATCHLDGRLYLRLAGAQAAVKAAAAALGGETLADADAFWRDLRDQRLAFFAGDGPLWRLSLRPTTPELDLPGTQLIEWGGALRWLRPEAEGDATAIRQAARGGDGHATLFRGARPGMPIFHPLPAALMKLHQRVKQAMDPAGILNPGRMYPEP